MSTPHDVARVRVQVDRLCWTAIGLGLAFTMTNVQQFAAAGAVVWSLPWLAAWLLDPTVSLALLAILRAEQVTARYQIRTGPWVRRAKWFTMAATYVMNTWSSYAAGSLSGIVLHSVPPLLVFVAAEAVTDLRDKLTQAVLVAHTDAAGHRPPFTADTRDTAPFTTGTPVTAGPEQVAAPEVPEPAVSPPVRARRITAAEYLTRARAAWTPDVVITPAWVREVTGCSRGLSSRLAVALSTEVTGDGTETAQATVNDGGGRS
nr:hypothetical protein [Kibdelosporangium sp. MJ126-NF4]CTQ94944.1 hypothetical protein [Kibdelosporangium sp. MJ126-NF4]